MSAMQQQLDQVNAALLSQPGNEMLLKLKADIIEGIKLASELGGGAEPDAAAAPAAGAAAAAPAGKRWKVGDRVQAKYSADGMMYEGTVQSVAGDSSGYTILFAGYNNSEVVAAEDVQPAKAATTAERAQTISGETGKTSGSGILSTDTAAQRAAKKKAAKGKRTHQRIKEQEEVLNAGKKNWKDFMSGTKGSKKRNSRGIARKSIFATPDTLDGRVGVVGSGAGMTEFTDRKKHKFAASVD